MISINKIPDRRIIENKDLFDSIYKNKQVKLYCDKCKEPFFLQKSKFRAKLKGNTTNFYCCRECYLIRHSENVKFYDCTFCGERFKGSDWNANKFCSRECYNKSEYHSKVTSGENHWQWKGGVSRGERNSPEYAEFRMKILKRDDFTCLCCGQRGNKKDNKLIAHHILAWKYYLEDRMNLDNCITLCTLCHRFIHSIYGFSKEPMIITDEIKKKCRNKK